MKKVVYIWIVIFAISIVKAQQEANIWYFGGYAGLDFSAGFPEPILTGMIDSNEGSAVICDKFGELLFYTDGVTVWNKNQETMKNGDSLKGHSSASQSSLIIPKPDTENIYYIFTVSDKDVTNGFCYSIVDMAQNSNLGEVVNKNLVIFDSTEEKLTAILHANGHDIWVIIHEPGNNNFHSYLITQDGISPFPVISSIGSVPYDNFSKIGYIKSSHAGNMIAMSNFDGIIEVFDFDRQTGIISNRMVIDSSDDYYGAYGLEFSPDDNLLYASVMSAHNQSRLYQFDLNAGNIEQSVTTVGFREQSNEFGALLLGPDRKIYIACYNNSSLAVINEPDIPGKDCEFNDLAVPLGGRYCMWGLPNNVPGLYLNKNSTNNSKMHDISGILLSPNPISEFFNVNYELRNSGHVSLTIYDMLGNKKAVLLNKYQEAGPYNCNFQIKDYELPKGFYILKFQAGNMINSQKIIIH